LFGINKIIYIFAAVLVFKSHFGDEKLKGNVV